MVGISVVIPCYNAVDDIEEAVDSVLQQSHDKCIKEIIIVDDGSTDESRAVIERLSTTDERIESIFLKENQGPSIARNTGVAHSTQDYVAFLDADDLWLRDKIEKQVQFIQDHPDVGLVCADYFTEVTNGEKRRIRARHFDCRRNDNLERLFVKGGPILMSTVVLKASCFRDIGGFNPSFPKGQDTDLWLRIAAEYPIHHLREPVVWKRKRKGSVGANAEVKAKYLHRITDDILREYPDLEMLRDKREALIENYVGTYFLRMGRRKEAIHAFVRSISLNKQNPKSYGLLFASCLPIEAEEMSTLLNTMGRIKTKVATLLR